MRPSRTAITRFFVATTVAAGLSLAARAQPLPGHEPGPGMMPPHAMHEMMPPHGGELPLPHYLRGLKLSEAQQDKIFAIFHDQAPQMRERAKALRKAHEDLREQAFAEQNDEARAKALAEAAGKAAAEMALLHLRTERQVLAVLTPEQRQEIAGKNYR